MDKLTCHHCDVVLTDVNSFAGLGVELDDVCLECFKDILARGPVDNSERWLCVLRTKLYQLKDPTILDKLKAINEVPIHFHWSFWAMAIGVVAYKAVSVDWIMASYYAFGIAAVWSSVLLHEFGHVYAAYTCGIKTSQVIAFPIGAGAFLERLPVFPLDELKIALAGPAVNFVLASVAMLVALIFPSLTLMLTFLTAVNIVLGIFNLIPAYPMDGGRVLRSALWYWKDDLHQATRGANRVGTVAAVGFVILGFLKIDPILIFIGFFVILAGKAEADTITRR